MSDWTITRMNLARDLDDVVALDAHCFVNPSTREMFTWEAEKSDVSHVFVMRPAAASDDATAADTDTTSPAGASTPARPPLVAYCAVWVIFDELHINTLAVHPDWRRQGIATRLLAHVFADAAGRGATKATLEVRRSNEAARNLYERLGFSVGGVRPSYYRQPVEDALILWRQGLDPDSGPPRDPSPTDA